MTDERAAQAAVQTAVAAFGRLDVVVNNAGYGDIAPFEQLSAERFKRAAEGAQWRDVSLSTDVASATALPAMRF